MLKTVSALALAAAFAATPVLAADTSADSNMAPTSKSSGVNVKGAPGSTNGPALDADSATSGSSTGESGKSPSDDAAKVPGAPGSTNGPAAKMAPDSSK